MALRREGPEQLSAGGDEDQHQHKVHRRAEEAGRGEREADLSDPGTDFVQLVAVHRFINRLKFL